MQVWSESLKAMPFQVEREAEKLSTAIVADGIVPDRVCMSYFHVACQQFLHEFPQRVILS